MEFKSFLKGFATAAVLLAAVAVADESINLGINVKIPDINARNWGATFRDNFAKPISQHDHTGGGKGLTLSTGAYQDNSVTGAKIRLTNNEAIRARNFANTNDVSLLKLNTSDQAEFPSGTLFSGASTFSNITINGGTISALTSPLPVAAGGTAATTAAAARTSLGINLPLGISDGGTGGTTASTARAALGLDTMATQNAAAVAITGGTMANVAITGGTINSLAGPVPILSGGTQATTAAGARTALGVAASGANSDITALTGIALSSWTPGVTANNGAAISALVINDAKYARIGPFIFVNLSVNFTIGTATPTIITITGPVAGTNHNGSDSYICAGEMNGTTTEYRWRFSGGNFSIFRPAVASITQGANASVQINGIYLA